MLTFGQRLKALRMATGKTLREFCQHNGLDAVEYSRLERDVTDVPLSDEAVLPRLPVLTMQSDSNLDELVELVRRT